jgi:hypothetical protein
LLAGKSKDSERRSPPPIFLAMFSESNFTKHRNGGPPTLFG